MYHIKKIGVLSLAKVQAVLSVAVMTVFDIFLFIVGYFGTSSYYRARFFDISRINDFEDLFYLGSYPTIYSLLGMLLLAGLLGFVMGAVIALLYNLAASWWGGLKLDITLEEEKK